MWLYVCVCECGMCEWVHVCVCECRYMSLCVSAHMCMYVYDHMYMYACECVYVMYVEYICLLSAGGLSRQVLAHKSTVLERLTSHSSRRMLVCPLWQISSRKQLRCQCVRAKPVTLAFQPPVVIAVTSAAVCRGGLGACIGLVLACVGLCIELAFFSPRKSLQVFLLKTMCCFVSGSGSAAEVHCPSNESHVFPWAAKYIQVTVYWVANVWSWEAKWFNCAGPSAQLWVDEYMPLKWRWSGQQFHREWLHICPWVGVAFI